jgi:hypothetical protein
MLFDLQSSRRRRVFIKVVYAGLAVLIGGGLILGTFGSSGGGLLDTLGLGNGGGGSVDSALQDQIDSAQKDVDLAPNDPAKLLELARTEATVAKQQVEVDDAGNPKPNSDASELYAKAADNWQKYLKLNGKKPVDAGAAVLIAGGFFYLAQTSTTVADADTNIKDAAAAQKIVADSLPGSGTYFNLALYSYFAGETDQAEDAVKKVEATVAGPQKAQVVKQFAQLAKNAKLFRKQVEAASKPQKGGAGATGTPGAPGSTNPFENPLGTSPLGGSSLGG